VPTGSLGRLMTRVIRQKVPEGAEQEAAEAAFFRIGATEGTRLHEVKKELLGQVIGAFGWSASSADAEVDRAPIIAAESFERSTLGRAAPQRRVRQCCPASLGKFHRSR